jgi:hypothetical protein
MITGQEKPDAGTIRIGETVKLGYVDQSRDALDPNKTVWEEISAARRQIDRRQAARSTRRAYVRRVQLQGLRPAEEGRPALGRRAQPRAPRQDAEERRQRAAARRADQRPRRRHAARARGGALDFAGCAVVISHDRWFLDRIATHILAFEGDSQVEWFEGNYQDYEADKHRARRWRRRPAAPHQVQGAAASYSLRTLVGESAPMK